MCLPDASITERHDFERQHFIKINLLQLLSESVCEKYENIIRTNKLQVMEYQRKFLIELHIQLSQSSCFITISVEPDLL